MDIQRKNVGRNKAIRWTIIGIVVVGVVVGLFVLVKGLKPAAPRWICRPCGRIR